MPTDIYVVRITPPAPNNIGNPSPWIQISRLDRTRRSPKPKLKVLESGYKEKLIDRSAGVPEEKAKFQNVAKHIGMIILKDSNNAKLYAK
jgi:hypothetical protein